MVSFQAAVFAALALVVAAVVCAIRLNTLGIHSRYPALLCFFLFQILITIWSNVAGAQNRYYALLYLILLPLEWLIYAWMVKEVYSRTFLDFPGLAYLGKWSIYGASFATVIVGLFSVGSALELLNMHSTVLPAIETVAHCLSFGFAALIVFLLFSMYRFPLKLPANVVSNSVLFGIILFDDAIALMVDQLTQRQFTAAINFWGNIATIACLAVWPFLLTRESPSEVPRSRFKPDRREEARLLDQLNAVNAVLLRAARR